VGALFRWAKRLAFATTLATLLAAAACWLLIRHYEADLPSIADLRGHYHPPQVTRVLARDGTLLAELFTERRTVVSIAALPAHVKLAVLAAEDAGFYEHEGLNYVGILRAMLVNLRAGRAKQGGSTITQQVVKNILLDSERSYRRKLREALLSRRLEQELTKDDILELYLNHIYFGHGRYGIEEAARDNFGKGARELTIAEAALLAGLVAGPESCSPRKDMKKALARRTFVLGQMRTKGFLSDVQHASAMDEPVRIVVTVEASSELAPEVVEIARRTLLELEPERSKRGGFTITTTLDPKLQASARKALREGLVAYDKRHGLSGPLKAAPVDKTRGKTEKKPKPAAHDDTAPFEGTPSFEQHKVHVGVVAGADDTAGTFDVRVGTALGVVKLADFERYNPGKLTPSQFAPLGAHVRVSLLAPLAEGSHELRVEVLKVPLRLEQGPEGALVALDVRTRQVLALVGSYEAGMGALDRATQARRQPGSTFKAIVYSYALHSHRFTASSRVEVQPDVFEGNFRPINHEGWRDKEPIRLREALAQSVNLVAVRVLREVGAANVVRWAEGLGIQSPMKPDLSLALGSYELRPIELVGAYATFAAGGMYEEPKVVTKITGPEGMDVPLKAHPASRRAMDEAEAYVTTSLLMSVIEHGTAGRARTLGRPLAGKTGTTNASKDTWFCGYSTETAAVVWIGYDDGKPLGGSEAGSVTALPVWIAFMKAAHEGRPKSDFPRPAGVELVMIDRKTGKLPYANDQDVYQETFLSGTQPTDIAEEPEDAGTADVGDR
jgi:penicillin-binding protein 1A